MRLLIGGGLGAVAAVTGWLVTRDLFAAPLFLRRNYRDAPVPVGVGILLVVATIAVEALLSVAEALNRGPSDDRPGRVVVILVALGFCLLGLFDDLAGSGDDRGFTGHLRAMAQGRLTTGGLKLLGGGMLAVVAASFSNGTDLANLMVDALVIALAANLGNLFDRAPGRTIKAGLLAAVPLLLLAVDGDQAQLTGLAVVMGAAAGLLLFDLREELMLGDAGSNVIGAVLAVGFVLTTGFAAHVVVLVVLVVLNVASERVSFSRVIDAVAPLRAVDRLGRRRPPKG